MAAAAGVKAHATYGVDVYDIDVASLAPGQWLRTNAVAYQLAALQHRIVAHNCSATAASAAAAATAPSAGASSVPVHSATSQDASVGAAGGSPLTPATTAPSTWAPVAPDGATTTAPCTALLLDPSVAQAMVAFGSAALGPVDAMCAAGAMLVPLTDYATQRMEGGDHWSFLVLRHALHVTLTPSPAARVVVSAVHVDSANNANQRYSKPFLQLLRASLYVPNANTGTLQPDVPFHAAVRERVTAWATANGVADAASVPVTIEVAAEPSVDRSFPQQPNSFDCGAFVCAGAAAWTAQVLQRPALVSVAPQATPAPARDSTPPAAGWGFSATDIPTLRQAIQADIAARRAA